MKIIEQSKTEQEKRATESTLRKKELQDLQKTCELSGKLSEVYLIYAVFVKKMIMYMDFKFSG